MEGCDDGLLIQCVMPKRPAALARSVDGDALEEGDIITAINGETDDLGVQMMKPVLLFSVLRNPDVEPVP